MSRPASSTYTATTCVVAVCGGVARLQVAMPGLPRACVAVAAHRLFDAQQQVYRAFRLLTAQGQLPTPTLICGLLARRPAL